MKTGSCQEQAPRPGESQVPPQGETNFYFYNARYYDPETARFVTADNLVDNESDTQGWNRFSYVKGNPVVYKDPTGHESNIVDKLLAKVHYHTTFDLNEKARYQAISNYNEKEQTTSVNGVKFVFKANDKDNSFKHLKNVKGELWNNLSIAAKEANVDGLYVTAINHKKNRSHREGRAMDITAMKTKGSTCFDVENYRNYNDGEWSSSEKSKSILDKFDTAFIKALKGSGRAFGPYRIRDGDKVGYKNMIDSDKYSDVGDVGNRKKRGEKFNQYVEENILSRSMGYELWRSYNHSSHGHYEIK